MRKRKTRTRVWARSIVLMLAAVLAAAGLAASSSSAITGGSEGKRTDTLVASATGKKERAHVGFLAKMVVITRATKGGWVHC